MLNLTPHEIKIQDMNDNEIITISPSGRVAEISMEETTDRTITAGPADNALVGGPIDVPTILRRFRIVGIDTDDFKVHPEGVLVSIMVLNNFPDDLRKYHPIYAPDTGETAIRDEEGRIVAVTQLITYSE